MKKKFDIYEFLKTRPLSWSALSSFEYNPHQWYTRYILKQQTEATPEMQFGTLIGERLASDPSYLPQVPRYSIFEHELKCSLGKIPLIGYMDSHEPHTKMYEYKTGRKLWDQKRADEHGQIDMYALMQFLIKKIRPEHMDISLVWLQTLSDDGEICFVDEKHPVILRTKRTMSQALDFGVRIQETVKAMDLYVNAQLK